MRRLRCHGNYRQQRGAKRRGGPAPRLTTRSGEGVRPAAKATTGVGRQCQWPALVKWLGWSGGARGLRVAPRGRTPCIEGHTVAATPRRQAAGLSLRLWGQRLGPSEWFLAADLY